MPLPLQRKISITDPASILDFLLRASPGTGAIYSAFAPAESKSERMMKSASRGLINSATLGYVQPDKDFKEEDAWEKASNFAGEIAGYMIPFGAASKVARGAGMAGKTALGRIGRGVAVGGSLGLAQKPEEDESRIENMLKSGASFGVFGAGGELLSKGASKVLPAVAKRLMPKGVNPYEARMAALRSQRASKVIGGVGSGKLDEGVYSNLIKELEPYLSRTKKGTLQGIVGTTVKETSAAPRFNILNTPKKQELFTQKVFMDKMKGLGFNPEKVRAKPTLGDEFRNFFDWADKVNTETGTKINPRTWVRASNKAHLSKMNNSSLIKTFESEFNKSGLSGKEFAKMIESKTDHPLVRLHKQITDTMGQEYKSAGGDIQFVKDIGYVPRQQAVYFSDIVGKPKKMGKLKTGKGFAEMSRTEKELSWVNRIDEPVKWLNRYAADVEKQYLKSVVPELNANYAQLKLLGLDGKANELRNQFTRASGLGEEPSRRLFSTNFLKGSDLDVDAALRIKGIDNQDISQKVYQTVQRLMFKSWVGLSPTAHVKQFLQPYLVGAAEIGPTYVRYGLKNRKALAKKYPNIEKRMKSEIAPPRGEFKYAEATPAEELAGKLGKKAESAIKFIEKPGEFGMKGFTWQDVERNRASMFWGAREKMLKEGVANGRLNPKILDGLAETDKRSIAEAFAKGGAEEAAYEYGLVKSFRTNFMYSAYDKPTILSGRIGKFVPFTTWGRNQWALYLGDVSKNNYDQLAKRIAYPLILLGMIEAATGQEIPNAHPANALSAPFQASIAPAITQPLENIAKGRYKYAGKQALATIPIASLLQRAGKIIDKGPIRGIGIKKASGKSILDLLGE